MTPKVVAKNNAYMHNRTAPSLQLIFSLVKKYHRNKLAIRENMTRSRKAVMFTLSGEAISGTPKISVMFMKQLPTIFPKAISGCP